MAQQRMYDVPPLGEPFPLRGARGAWVVLDEFAPTHLDAWLARVARPGEPVVRAVVVRHAGDVRGRSPLVGRRRVEAAFEPAGEALLGVVVEERATTLLPLPPGDPARHAANLSRADWRAFV